MWGGYPLPFQDVAVVADGLLRADGFTRQATDAFRIMADGLPGVFAGFHLDVHGAFLVTFFAPSAFIRVHTDAQP